MQSACLLHVPAMSIPAIIAHRGASEEAPENTLDAFRLAWEQGADAIEMDLRTTRDGRIAVLHDADLRRVAGDARQINQMTAAELKQVSASRGKSWRWSDAKVPLLEEVLSEVPKGRSVFLEIKEGTAMLPALRRIIETGELAGSRITILCFDRAVLAAAKKQMPAVDAAWVVDYPSVLGFERLVSTAVSLHLDGIDVSVSWPLDERRVKRAHEAGLKVHVWTVDEVPRARELMKAGVDGITTNAPLRLRRGLGA